jgi:hypothetical protein
VTEPLECVDTASEVINAFIVAMREAFDPESVCPPDGGGSTDVRFFAGDAAPAAAWDAHADGAGCSQPFLWVRVVQRYRSKEFPAPMVVTDCDLPRVMEVEVGVARCAVTDEQPTWEQYTDEANVSLDDSWRIEKALCRVRGLLNKNDYRVGAGSITPYGPEGGLIAWSGVAFVQF